MILCSKPEKVSKLITHELGLGLTFIKGKGGYSGEDRDILFIIVERLDLAELKEIVLREDPSAFIAIEKPPRSCLRPYRLGRYAPESKTQIFKRPDSLDLLRN